MYSRRSSMGDGIDLSSIISSLPSALSQGATAAEGSLLSQVLSNQQVQTALSNQAQQTASQQLAASFLANKWLYLGGGALALLIIYSLGRGRK